MPPPLFVLNDRQKKMTEMKYPAAFKSSRKVEKVPLTKIKKKTNNWVEGLFCKSVP